jgi:hypothetical protein
MNPTLMAMLSKIMPFLRQGSTGPGSVGTTPTPAMQQAAVQSGAVTPQDAATSTIAGTGPSTPSAGFMQAAGAPGAGAGAAAGGGQQLAQLAQKLQAQQGQGQEQGPTARPFISGGGQGPQPINTPAFGRPPQGGGMPQLPPAVGAFLMSPQGRALLQQMQGMMAQQQPQ